jgi:23S rRNA pseudouridine1911/1915/1917 synthase
VSFLKPHTVQADEAGRVDIVVQKMTGMTRKNVTQAMKVGRVVVNGEVVTDNWQRVEAGDKVELREPPSTLEKRQKLWQDSAFDIVYEDEHMIVVDKSAAILTVPVSEGQTNTLVHRISNYFSHGLKRRKLAYIVHRLDQGVSGLLVFGKTQEIADKLRDQFEARKPKRLYVAIVWGSPLLKKGTIRSYLATDAYLNRYSTDDESKGELAITHYEVQKVFKSNPVTSLIHVRLETGRRNQIRIHMTEKGHPILGDPRYGKDRGAHPRWKARRLALHAASLAFTHPVTGKDLSFESELPSSMRRFIEQG